MITMIFGVAFAFSDARKWLAHSEGRQATAKTSDRAFGQLFFMEAWGLMEAMDQLSV